MAALVLGGMAFFAFVYAPLVFTKLPAATAGPFIRAVFPVYYRIMGAVALLSGVLLLPGSDGLVMITVGAVFFAVMLALMPRINASRDASLAGDEAIPAAPAARRFSRLHRTSVVINFLQMLAVFVVVLRLLAHS